MREIRGALLLGFLIASLPTANAFAQNFAPTVDGGAGPCSVEFTATDANGALVSNAQISVHVEYGFLGARKLDLQVATDSHGKARFVGLPEKVDGALYFEAAKGNLKGVATVDPNTDCQAHHGIYMTARNFAEKPKE